MKSIQNSYQENITKRFSKILKRSQNIKKIYVKKEAIKNLSPHTEKNIDRKIRKTSLINKRKLHKK